VFYVKLQRLSSSFDCSAVVIVVVVVVIIVGVSR